MGGPRAAHIAIQPTGVSWALSSSPDDHRQYYQGHYFLNPYSEQSTQHVFSLVLASSQPGERRCGPILQMWTEARELKPPAPGHPDKEVAKPHSQLGCLTLQVHLQGPSRGQCLPEPGAPSLQLFWLQCWKPHCRDQSWGLFLKALFPSLSWAKTSRGDSRQDSIVIFSDAGVRGDGQCFLEVSEPKDSPLFLLKADSRDWPWSFRGPGICI